MTSNMEHEGGSLDGLTSFPGSQGVELNLTRQNGCVNTAEFTEEKVSFWKLFKQNWVSVLIDCLVFAIFGMSVAFLGPTLFDLGCQTRADLKEMNWVFFVQLLMTLVGSISSGCLADRYVPPYILLCIGMTGLPVCMFLVPTCITFAGLLINLLVMGWFMGCIDTIANLRMILRFGSNVTPFLQAMHFGYGLGAFLSPMIASPFLLNIDCSPFIDGYTAEPQVSNQRIVNVSRAIAPQLKKVMRAVHLSHSHEAFYILGCIQLLITLAVLTVVFLERKWGIVFGNSSPRHSLHDTRHQSPEATDFQEYRGSKALARLCGCGRKEVVIITVLTSASLFIYDGLQSSYADYIYSYALKNVNELERREGAILNSCFWGTFALGRLIAIIMATHFSAKFMLICNITGCCIAMFLTLIWQTSRVAIYIGTCIMGLFLSSLSPTVMSLSEQFIDLNAAMTSCLVVFAALGEMICPVIVGNLFVSIGPVSFLAFCFSIVLISFVLFWILYAVGKDTQKYRGGGHTSFVWLQRSVPSMQSESSQINSGAVKYYSPTTDETHSMEMNGMTPISDSDMHPRDFER